jgi:hypothetical protein
MSFQCYIPRASFRSALAGGLFIAADGSRRVIPDRWLNQAELRRGSRLLRLTYSFCAIEVSGDGLDPIFEDASIGRLGTIQAAPAKAIRDKQLWVTGIAIVPLSELPFPDARTGVLQCID